MYIWNTFVSLRYFVYSWYFCIFEILFSRASRIHYMRISTFCLGIKKNIACLRLCHIWAELTCCHAPRTGGSGGSSSDSSPPDGSATCKFMKAQAVRECVSYYYLPSCVVFFLFFFVFLRFFGFVSVARILKCFFRFCFLLPLASGLKLVSCRVELRCVVVNNSLALRAIARKMSS